MKTLKYFLVKILSPLFILAAVLLVPTALSGEAPLSYWANWYISLCLLASCVWVVLRFSEFWSRTMVRVSLFAAVLLFGGIVYFCDLCNLQQEQAKADGATVCTAVPNAPAQSGQTASAKKQPAPKPVEKQQEQLLKNHDFFISVLLGIFSSLAEFFPSRGSYRHWLDYPPLLKILFLVFYLLTYMFVISFLLSLLGRKLINRFRLLQARDARKHVFWCRVPNRKEKLLATDILKQNKRDCVIFSVRESVIEDIRTFVDQMQHSGFLLCLRKPGQFHDSDCLTAPRHFFLTEDFNWNFRQARKVLDRMQEIGFHAAEVHFYIRVTADEKNYCAVRWADCQRQAFPWLKIHLIDEPSLAARMLQLEHPLLAAPGISIGQDTCKVKGSFRVLLLGFSDGGQALLREIVCNGQFLHTDPRDEFRVDVIDRNSTLTGGYIARYPDAVRDYNISFYNMDVLSGECYRWLEHNLFRYNRIIVAFWNDDLNLEVAAIISRLSKYLGLISDPAVKCRLEGLYPKIWKVEDELNDLQKRITSAESGLKKLLTPENELEGRLKELSNQKANADEVLKKLLERIESVENDLNELQQQITPAENNLSRLRGKKANAERRLKELPREIQDAEVELTRKTAAETRFRELPTKTDAENKLQELSAQKTAADSKLKDLQRQKTAAETELKKLPRKIAAAENELNNLSKLKEKAESKLEELSVQKQTAKNKQNELQVTDAVEKEIRRKKDLENDSVKWLEQKEKAESKLEELQKQKADAENKLNDLLKEKAAEESKLPEYMTDRLFVRFSRSIAGSEQKKNDASPDVFPEFRFFGSNEDCYRRKYIIDEELDDRAKRVHRIWSASNSPDPNKDDEDDWNSQDMFTQESNRACADGLYNLLRLMNNGREFDRRKEMKALLDRTRFLRDKNDKDNKLEILAETEHLRWNAFHLMRGIRPWPLWAIPESGAHNGKGERKAKDIEARLRHAAITDYSVLPEVDKRFGKGDLQGNDKNLIEKMETILCDDPVKPWWKKILEFMTSPFRRR